VQAAAATRVARVGMAAGEATVGRVAAEAPDLAAPGWAAAVVRVGIQQLRRQLSPTWS
jgi:hypothetical protein